MRKNILLLFLYSTFAIGAFGQSYDIDSLLTAVKNAKTDTSKMISINLLSREYINIGEYDSSLFYSNFVLSKATEISKQKKDSEYATILKKCISAAYNNIGNVHYEQGNYPAAIKNYSVSLKIREELDDKAGIATSYNNMGIVYYAQGNYPEALKKYFACLKLREATGNKAGIASAYSNIGNIYDEEENYPEALKNHFAALKLRREVNDKKGIAITLNNIGNVYNNQGNYEEALKNHWESLKIKKENSDKRGIATSYNNIGNVYENQRNFSEAEKNFIESLKIREEIGDQIGIASSYNSIGSVYLSQKKYEQAKAYLLKALQHAQKNNYKVILKETFLILTDLYNCTKNYKDAFESHKLYILYRDSIDNEDAREKTIQNQLTYDFEKKEAATKAEQAKKDIIAEDEKQKQKIITSSVSVGLLLVALLALFVFRSYRQKQKANIIITQQKQLVEEQQKEIIDSIKYAKRVQQAILPSDEEIKKHLPDSFILYKPKSIVAGDFYWFHESHENNNSVIFIAAADSTGHGVPGAMVSVVCSNALNRAVNEFNLTDTGKILDKTRELVLETFAKSGEEIKDGMDISLLAINKAEKKINWSGANNSLHYITNNELKEIKANKQAIGKTENALAFTTHTIELKKGDFFYLISDGYADQFGGEHGKKFKSAKLKELFVAVNSQPTLLKKEIISTTFETWKGNLEQVDDVCVIGVRV